MRSIVVAYLLVTVILGAWGQESPDALAPGAFGTRAGAPIQRVACARQRLPHGWAQLGIRPADCGGRLALGAAAPYALGRQNRRRLAPRRTDTHPRNAQRGRRAA
jgi:hypothetical protein